MKTILILYFIFCMCFSSVWAKELAHDSKGTAVSDKELLFVIDEGSLGAQKTLLNSPARVERMVRDIYKIKALAKEAKELGVGESSADQLQLQKMIDEFYAKRLLDEYIAKKLPDMSGLAMREYQVNSEKYKTDEKVDISHIQIKSECRTKAAAADLANELLTQLGKGADFDEMVMKFSEDKGKLENKGYLGEFKRGQIIEEFENAAFAMEKPGQLSDVIEYKDSFFILRLNKKVPSKLKEFEEVKEDILVSIRSKVLETKREDLIAELMEDNEVQFNQADIIQLIKEKKRSLPTEDTQNANK